MFPRISNWLHSNRPALSRVRPPRPQPTRPLLEALEDRTVPSLSLIPTVTSLQVPTTWRGDVELIYMIAQVKTASGAPFSVNPTGTVDFYDGNTDVSGPQPFSEYVPGEVIYFSTDGVPGTHVIHAVYSGDTVYQGSTSPDVSLLVQQSTSISMYTTTPTPAFGQPLTVSALVSTKNGTTLTGSIAFSDNGNSVGSASVSPYGSGAVAFLTTTLSTVGSHQISASYTPGDATQRPVSWSLTENVTGSPLDVTFTLLGNGNLYKHDPGGWTPLASGVRAISNTGNDGYGHAMIDVTFAGCGTYEFRDTGGAGTWNYLAGGVTSAAAGYGVSDVIVSGAYLFQFNDWSGQWTFLAAGVKQVSAGTDQYGYNQAAVLANSGDLWTFNSLNGWQYLAGGVVSASAGQNGDLVALDGAGNLYLYVGLSWSNWFTAPGLPLATNIAAAWVGTDLYGNTLVEMKRSDNTDFQYALTRWSAPGIWSELGYGADWISAPNGGTVLVNLYGGTLYYRDVSGNWIYLASNVV